MGDTYMWSFCAVRNRIRRLAIARALLNTGANPNCTDTDGQTALHYAVESRGEAMVALLMASGANPNAKNTMNGQTPLHHASVVGTGSVRLVERLLDHGADPNTSDDAGETPLHLAVKTLCNLPYARFGSRAGWLLDDVEEQVKIVELLVEAGADVNAVNELGEIPIVHAETELAEWRIRHVDFWRHAQRAIDVMDEQEESRNAIRPGAS